MKNLGILIIIIGIVIAAVTSFNYVTKKNVVDIGTLEITRNRTHYLSWSPFIGIATIIVGAGILFYGMKK
jgi:uncharacterized membrane protein YidH (DUF202 family)